MARPFAEGWDPGGRQRDRQTEAEQREEGSRDGGQGRREGTEDGDGEKGCCEAAEGEKERERLEGGGHTLSASGQRCGEGRLSTRAWGSGLDPTPRLPPAHHHFCVQKPAFPSNHCSGAGRREGKSPFSLTWRKDERKRCRPPLSSRGQRGLGEVPAQPIHSCPAWGSVAGADWCQGIGSETASRSLPLSLSRAVPGLSTPPPQHISCVCIWI